MTDKNSSFLVSNDFTHRFTGVLTTPVRVQNQRGFRVLHIQRTMQCVTNYICFQTGAGCPPDNGNGELKMENGK